MTKEELMRKAIELSKENIENGGGPFGAVIATKEGEIVATGVNRVTASCDPTAHAEVSAIRTAAAKLGTFNLSGYEIYTSCEHCHHGVFTAAGTDCTADQDLWNGITDNQNCCDQK